MMSIKCRSNPFSCLLLPFFKILFCAGWLSEEGVCWLYPYDQEKRELMYLQSSLSPDRTNCTVAQQLNVKHRLIYRCENLYRIFSAYFSFSPFFNFSLSFFLSLYLPFFLHVKPNTTSDGTDGFDHNSKQTPCEYKFIRNHGLTVCLQQIPWQGFECNSASCTYMMWHQECERHPN